MTTGPSPRSQAVAAIFDRAAATYDQLGVPWFTPIAEGLVAELRPVRGERVLDVGCGRGAALFQLAEAVGPTGQVTGIDLAPGMVAAVRSEVLERGLTQVDVHVMDAAAPELAAAPFDALTSSLVLFFLPDPAAALAAWNDLLVPGGRIGISTFGPQDPRWLAVDDVFTPYLPPQLLDARTSGKSGPFSTDQGVENLFLAAGFTGIRTVSARIPVVFDGAQQWREWTWSHGQRGLWESVPQDRRDDVLAEATRRLEAARDQSGTIGLWQQVRYTLGRRTNS